MNNELSEVLLDFYRKILAPEFESIQKKQAAHDEKLIDILGHFGIPPQRVIEVMSNEYREI